MFYGNIIPPLLFNGATIHSNELLHIVCEAMTAMGAVGHVGYQRDSNRITVPFAAKAQELLQIDEVKE